MTTIDQQVQEFGRRWVAAEQSGDVETLDSISTEDFVAVGPLGFTLDKPKWLDRYRTREFVTESLDWQDLQVRQYGDTVLVVGVHDQRATYQGNPSNGRFRATHVLVRAEAGWLLAGMHLSPIAAPPAAPPAGR